MTPLDDFHARRRECPLVAILRGLTLHEADGIGEALVEAGIGIIEVPLNSPQPLASIEALAMRLGDRAMIGAGTVTTAAEVSAVGDAGGTLIVSPHVDQEVIAATVANGLVSLPGFFSPTEAFAALRAFGRKQLESMRAGDAQGASGGAAAGGPGPARRRNHAGADAAMARRRCGGIWTWLGALPAGILGGRRARAGRRFRCRSAG